MKIYKFELSNCIVFSWILLFVISCSLLLVNFIVFNYHGNDYFPPNSLYIFFSLFLMLSGSILLFGANHRISQSLKELIIFFAILSVIALATNAVQLTPFQPIDNALVDLEQFFRFDLLSLVTWSTRHPWLRGLLTFAYNSLPFQLAFLPLLIILAGDFKGLQKFYLGLLLTAIIGFSFYYFFPSVGPATTIKGSVFLPEQFATGIKFYQIHHYQTVTTIAGGLIAMPSFHVIWGLYCVRLLKGWRLFYPFLWVLNSLLIISCVVLGWHYPSDIIGAVIVIALADFLTGKCL